MRLLSAVKTDITFQYRHYLYAIYLFISILYILLLYFIPDAYKEQAAIFILFSDCSFLGSFFIGGIMLLEKEQGIYDNMFVTPLRIQEFIWSKVLSLGILSVLSSLLIFTFTFGFSSKTIVLLVGVALNSIFATLLGMTFAPAVKSINQYLILSPLFVTVFFLPVLDTLGLFYSPLFVVIPGNAGLLLMEGAFISLTLSEWIYSVLLLGFYIYFTYTLALKSFQKYIVMRIGG